MLQSDPYFLYLELKIIVTGFILHGKSVVLSKIKTVKKYARNVYSNSCRVNKQYKANTAGCIGTIDAKGGELHSLGGKFALCDVDLFSSAPHDPCRPDRISARRIIKRMMDHGNQEDKKIGRLK